jgi:hypothetical protein
LNLEIGIAKAQFSGKSFEENEKIMEEERVTVSQA